jgi:hypothetical protein
MPNTQCWVAILLAFGLSGCIKSTFPGLSPVAQGAILGAASGAALGAGTGVLISNEHLLGSSKASNMALDPGASIAAGSVVGAVFGAIIGAMAGHQSENNLLVPPVATTARVPAAL